MDGPHNSNQDGIDKARCELVGST